MRLRRVASSWALALVLSAVTGLTVVRLVAEAAERAGRLGGLRPVAVAARPVPAGRALSAADVSIRSLPAAVLPEGRVAPAPVGRVALVPLAAGEVLLAAKLAPDGVDGPGALLPPGDRALAVPVAPGSLPLRAGQRVDVLATFDHGGGEEASGPPTFAVARAALVLAVGEEWVTVAVAPTEAARVAFAVARGTVALAITAPG